jgi:hypothetical protein
MGAGDLKFKIRVYCHGFKMNQKLDEAFPDDMLLYGSDDPVFL